jgi:hypothetical protein
VRVNRKVGERVERSIGNRANIERGGAITAKLAPAKVTLG